MYSQMNPQKYSHQVVILKQTSPREDIPLPIPIGRIFQCDIELITSVGVTTTGLILYLNSDTIHGLQETVESRIDNAKQSIVWVQNYPILTIRASQFPPISFRTPLDKLAEFNHISFDLKSDGIITFAPGAYMLWRLILSQPASTPFNY